jgi:putative DNA primase/helicase
MQKNHELISFLQRAIGYSLTGNTSERCLFICWGTGANGKSTFLDVLKAMLGDHAATTAAQTLMMKRPDAPTADVAALKGARLAVAGETEQGQYLAEAQVKAMTGGTDEMSVRLLYRDFFTFRPTFKVWLATNHRPAIRGTDNAIWDRIRLIPFAETIPPAEQDRGLADKLKAELDGVLAWAVRGCLDWQRDGLRPPDIVQTATAEYRKEMDVLAAFLDDQCVFLPLASVAAGQLYTAYKTWTAQAGEETLSQRAFSARMKERGFETGKRDAVGRYVYRGIGLAQALPEPSEPSEPSRGKKQLL